MVDRLDKFARGWEIERTAMLIVQQRKQRRAKIEATKDKENVENNQEADAAIITKGVNNLRKHDHLDERILLGLALTGVADAYGVKSKYGDREQERKDLRSQKNERLKRENEERLRIVHHKCDEILLCRPNLVVLDLSNMKLGDDHALLLSKAIMMNTVIRTFNFQQNDVTDRGWRPLAHCLQLCRQASVINMGSNMLTDRSVKRVVQVLKRNNKLLELNLTGKKEKIDHFRALANRPRVPQPRITHKGVATLTLGLSAHPSLTQLSMAHQSLGDMGALLLADTLLHNERLTSLELNHNGVGPEGARAFGSLLALNVTLQHLDLASNDLRDEGVCKLAVGMRANSALRILDVAKTKHTSHACGILTKALQARSYGAKLSVIFHGNGYPNTDPDAEALLAVIKAKEAEHRVNSRRKSVCVADMDTTLMEMRDEYRAKFEVTDGAWASLRKALR